MKLYKMRRTEKQEQQLTNYKSFALLYNRVAADKPNEICNFAMTLPLMPMAYEYLVELSYESLHFFLLCHS